MYSQTYQELTTRYHKDRGLKYISSKKWARAIKHFRIVSRKSPADLWAQKKIAECLYQSNKIVQASEAFKSLAKQYERKGECLKALGLWKRSQEIDPSYDTLAHIERVKISIDTGVWRVG